MPPNSPGPKARRSHSKSKSSSTKTTRPSASSPEVRRRMQVTRRRDTPGELALRAALHALGLRYRIDGALPDTRRRADIAFFSLRVAVFVDGCFWHGCPEHGTWPKTNAEWWRTKIKGNVERDRDTDVRLRSAGWTVMRFWAHDDMKAAAKRVAQVVQIRKKKTGPTARPRRT
ncbi:MAG: DNA mismatch endonuclease Vsr [Acidobacteria bacterium]|nr:DNA mismatch endonuclease Vsr [Acidobacteriota bacterium]